MFRIWHCALNLCVFSLTETETEIIEVKPSIVNVSNYWLNTACMNRFPFKACGNPVLRFFAARFCRSVRPRERCLQVKTLKALKCRFHVPDTLLSPTSLIKPAAKVTEYLSGI